MVYAYVFRAPDSELHGEPFSIQAQTRGEADARADFHVRDTFSLTTRTDVRAEFIAEYTSRRAAERALDTADALPAPAKPCWVCLRAGVPLVVSIGGDRCPQREPCESLQAARFAEQRAAAEDCADVADERAAKEERAS